MTSVTQGTKSQPNGKYSGQIGIANFVPYGVARTDQYKLKPTASPNASCPNSFSRSDNPRRLPDNLVKSSTAPSAASPTTRTSPRNTNTFSGFPQTSVPPTNAARTNAPPIVGVLRFFSCI